MLRGIHQIKLLSLALAQDGTNILKKEYLLEHLRAYNQVISQVVKDKNGKAFAWGDICETVSETNKECKVESILRYWNYNETTLRADPNPLATINSRNVTNYLGQPLRLGWVLGGVKRDASGALVAAEVFQTVLNMRVEAGVTVKDDDITIKWQERITEVAYDDWSSPLLAQYVSCDGAIGRESTKAINNDVKRLTVGYILLIAYTIIVLYRNSWAYQKAHVALGSFITIGMGIAADFGFLSGVGVEFNFVCQVLPFLLVGVGVDSTFVIISNYFDQDPDAPIEHRIGEAMALAGSSITVSCSTNVIAFAVGTYTNLQALLSFSIYASVGTLLVFIFQVTTFPAFLALDARRELRNRLRAGCCWGCVLPCCCQKEPVEEQLKEGNNGWSLDSNAYKHAGTPGPSEPPSHHPGASRSGSGTCSTADVAVKVAVRPPSPDAKLAPPVAKPSGLARDFTSSTITCCEPRVFDPHTDQFTTRLVARWLPRVSLSTWGKIAVVALECVMLGFAIYGCTKTYMDFNFRGARGRRDGVELFVPKGNWLHKAYAVEDRYFGGEKVPVAVYTRGTVDGRDYFYYQDQLAALGAGFAADPYIADTPPITSWYASFSAWLAAPGSPYASRLTAAGRAPDEASFNAWLRVWLQGEGRAAQGSILFNNSTGRIMGSRMSGFTQDVVDGSWAVRAVDSTRDTVAAAAPDLDAIAFGFSYTFWDGFRQITYSTITNVAIAAAAVFLIVLLLLADIMSSLLVGLMVILADVGILGFMHYGDLQFNSVTCIVLVLAVGISVDYSAHVMRAFLVAEGTRQERAHKALIEIGGAVYNGAITTFLAVLPMSMAKHYIFTTIFAMWSVLVLLAIWHGIVLLPVLLSWIGPSSYASRKDEKEDEAAAAPVPDV
ncbi:Protein patched 2 [Tetrabaena socialis]|uniref:Protein patched 2 n=1 Tax=Tetrabaena socialis TaxID=47790 RepID=A0A2J8ADV0_9CHLO|nr:Protein patched 2 [Tetrabaena socialis]|eukprot:PNH10676.1 Protein patched 2 [Tetrabaena socialis]